MMQEYRGGSSSIMPTVGGGSKEIRWHLGIICCLFFN